MSLLGHTEGAIAWGNELHDADIFKLEETRRIGVLNIPDEIEITYDRETGEWSGEAIRSDGWVDLDDEELWLLIVANDLESLV